MADKALTVAIAGALAAPMAAQAVDFTISGHVNRALFVTDKDDGTNPAKVADNGSSGTRIRVMGTTDLENGNSVDIQFEYGHSGGLGKSGALKGGKVQATDGLTLRHANIQYSGGFGKITIGQGSEAGDGSPYSDKSGVLGIGHGQDKGDSSLGAYFGDLGAGGRKNMLRYDTPSLGPISAAVSVANDDRVSGLLSLASDLGGTSVGAMLGTLQERGDSSTVSASIGAKMPSGLTISGAWAKGKDQGGTDPTPPTIQPVIECPEEVEPPQSCGDIWGQGRGDDRQTESYGLHTPAKTGTDGTDPSYFQATVGYVFGNSAVAASWYQSSDFKAKGSEGTALGIGVKHTLPKAAAELYAAVQNYDVKPTKGAESMDDTVFVVGTRVKF